MTVRELMETLEHYVNTDKEALDYNVVMVGHDADGARLYDIGVNDPTIDFIHKTVTMWD